ncbi:MAG: excinuclease ABC subunit UvrC [Candidatus Omnitrophica bacterium]|nr:excinuclease ABC subunit UvrC [Candidatus Omnitrophota bacterium]
MIDKVIIKKAPDSPGVYLMKDAQGGIVYVGKAVSLKKRLASYFTPPYNAKTEAMLSNAARVDLVGARTEAEALLLEARLIKQYRPKYNISLKDDKSYPFVKITKEKFPSIFICRGRKDDGATYLGPFTSAKLLRQALKTARSVFGFRDCACRIPSKKPSLYYRLGLCPGPCIGAISEKEYRNVVKNVRMFLEGRYEDVVRKLSAKMRELSRQQRFEQAALVRDKINALGAVSPGTGLLSEHKKEIGELKDLLGLKLMPRSIEAFDISNISSTAAVGSMVSFYEGLPDKDNYRRFKIKGVSGIDDYAMMREVVRRRCERLMKEGKEYPDLIVIDGGIGHLNSAVSVLEELRLNIPVISIAKQEEKIYVKGRTGPLDLNLDSPAMHLIQRIRNEAHRFALKYHRFLRKKRTLEA